jgi:endonuclease/exonuclease/phosphatase family metal-dependent hydrolase
MKKVVLLILFVMSIYTSSENTYQPENISFKQSRTSELKILSWNIYMLPYISLVNNNAKRAKIIAEKLVDSDYKIIVFQEAFSSKCRRIISEKLKEDYPYQYGPANRNTLPLRTNSGLWIVSKIPLFKKDEIQFSNCKGFDAVARKGAVLFDGYYNGSKFQILATHLQAENSHELRKQQCFEIKQQLLDPYYSEKIPQFICGDFNVDMDDTHNYRQMLTILDAKNGEISGNVKVTYDEINNNLAYNSNGKSRVIDYVLVRNEELIHRIERKVQTFFTSMKGNATYLSDHYAMEFSVKFPVSESDEISLFN